MDAGRFNMSALAGHIPLRRGDPALIGFKAYRDLLQGSNLVRKAAQLVNDIERLRDIPSFRDFFNQQPAIKGANPFDKILSDLRESTGVSVTLDQDGRVDIEA